jgi:UDP-N-acetylmuramoyl-tripeptide--D-alanyl-D-alanine ligase
MLELGQYEQQGHRMVGMRAAQVAEHLVTVGERGRLIASAARQAGLQNSAVQEFDLVDSAIEYLRQSLAGGDVVLVKGSHGIHMERIVNALEVEA